MDTLAIATVAAGAGPQQLQPPPEPAQAQQQTQFTTPLPQHAASAQQSQALHQTPPRPVEDAERGAERDSRREPDNKSAARNRGEGKGMRLDLRA